jgi:hypothetical protein
MGVGRSALIAACVLIANGISAHQIWGRLESAGEGVVPDTQELKEWANAFPKLIQKGLRLASKRSWSSDKIAQNA